MPQMMPMSWSIMFIMFSMIFILFATTNYYINMPSTKIITKKKTLMKTLNWKW
uniref:ATP synthase F0 subunit 8 n=1 Tax=Neotermes phragmosus TaxID=2942698 RepID=A0A8X8RGG7_9NEOP|nr:ATP synthase F0 subunit 8 [Neotermes phragmosus]